MNQHFAVLNAKKYNKVYYVGTKGWYDSTRIIKTRKGKEVENELLWDGQLDSPHLKVGEALYISELDLEVTIESSMRATDGSVIYQTDYKFDLIEDDETEASKIRAEKELKEFEEWTEKQKACKTCEPEVKKTWWQRLFNQ